MSTSSETHETLTVITAAELQERAAAASWLASPERQPFSVLPEGWSVIGRCRFGTGMPGPSATGCHALAHPDVGVALIDIAPNATPNAEARLRRALTAAEFWPDFPGTLPVMHDRVDGTALRSLHPVLERGFAALPALTVPGGVAWIEGVQRAMAADSAWELPGQPKAVQDVPPAPADDAAAAPPRSRSARPRRWGRVATLPLAFAATFGVGLVSGFLLLDSPAPVAPAPPVVAAAPQPSAAPAQQSLAAAPEAAPRAPTEATPAAGPAPAPSTVAAATPPPVSAPSTVAAVTPRPAPESVAPTATPAAAAPAVTVPATAPAPAPAAVSPPAAPQAVLPAAAEAPLAPPAPAVEAPAPVQQAFGADGPVAPSPLETRLSHSMPALPVAPPRAPSPPVRVSAAQQASRSAPVIDRACSRALLRFQQGERLTAAEQGFIRTGCSTTRR